MSDITVTIASFRDAYRAYAVEQGNDAYAAGLAAQEAAESTSVEGAASAQNVEDVVYISPAAAELYIAQVGKTQRVGARPRVEAYERAQSATAGLAAPDREPGEAPSADTDGPYTIEESK